MKTYAVEAGEGKYRVCLTATVTVEGIIINLLGGERPHLGAMVLSIPRPGLADPGKVSCTTSVIPLLGHKDDEAARPVAEMIARATGHPVSVAAGIHVGGAAQGDIALLLVNTDKAAKSLLNLLKVDNIVCP